MAKKPALVHHRRSPVGAPPGLLVPDEHASPTTMRMTVIDDDKAVEVPDVGIEDVRKAVKSGKRLWVDVIGLADLELIAAIGELFEMDPLAIEDVANTDQRPKVDVYDGHPLIVVHMFDGKSVTSKEQFAIVFDKTHVVTFQERPGDCLEPVRKRLEAPTGRIRKRGAPYLVYAILDTILDAYFPLLEAIGEELEDLEDRITFDPRPNDVTDLHAIKRQLLTVKRALWPSREMLSALSREELGLIPRDISQYLRDTYDHSVQLIDVTETYRELATGLLDLYLSSVSTKMNEVMKVLTIISTIFIPLGFLAGIWGMNFDPGRAGNMPELDLPYAYPMALGLMAVIAIGLLIVFRLKRWL
ncbi:MAG: magnesium/cobalt transporter CorA [Rhizobiaceae bacterium]|nr:magnesium/cobalt transporter CorA [Rhizobiaceae bacterium]